MSAPAQKDGPSPERTMTRVSVSLPNETKVSASSAIRASSKALRTAGRARTTRATGPSRVSLKRASLPLFVISRQARWLHPEDAELRLFHGGVAGGGESQREDGPGLGGVEHAVVPEAGRRIVGGFFRLRLLAGRALQGRDFFPGHEGVSRP